MIVHQTKLVAQICKIIIQQQCFIKYYKSFVLYAHIIVYTVWWGNSTFLKWNTSFSIPPQNHDAVHKLCSYRACNNKL